MNPALRRWKDNAAVAALAAVVLTLALVQLPILAERIETGVFSPDPLPADAGPEAHGAVMPALETPLAPTATEAGLPVEASVWLAPMAGLGTSTGLGWVESTDNTPLGTTSEDRHGFHVRLGGGLMAPLTPSVGVDIRG